MLSPSPTIAQLKTWCQRIKKSKNAIQIVHCANTIYLPIKIHFIIYAEQFLPITTPTHRSLIKLEEKKKICPDHFWFGRDVLRRWLHKKSTDCFEVFVVIIYLRLMIECYPWFRLPEFFFIFCISKSILYAYVDISQ